jgi:sugar (pentulose or hexulose) kinase
MQEATTQEPNAEAVRRYEEAYATFRRLTEGLKPMFEITLHV